jgi:hypothetical protein
VLCYLPGAFCSRLAHTYHSSFVVCAPSLPDWLCCCACWLEPCCRAHWAPDADVALPCTCHAHVLRRMAVLGCAATFNCCKSIVPLCHWCGPAHNHGYTKTNNHHSAVQSSYYNAVTAHMPGQAAVFDCKVCTLCNTLTWCCHV